MRYIPTKLPQYWKLHQRADFSNAQVQLNHVLLFSQNGTTITAKLPDGSFVDICDGTSSNCSCSENLDLQFGYITENFTFKPWAQDSNSISLAVLYINVLENMSSDSCALCVGSDSIILGWITAVEQFCPVVFRSWGTQFGYPQYQPDDFYYWPRPEQPRESEEGRYGVWGSYSFYQNFWTNYNNGLSFLGLSISDSIPNDLSSLIVYSSGSINNCELVKCGMTVKPYGTVNSLTVSDQASLVVSSGATVTNVKQNGGYVKTVDGAQITFVPNVVDLFFTPVTWQATAHSGTTICSGVVQGDLYVSGGLVDRIEMNGGTLQVCSGGSAKKIRSIMGHSPFVSVYDGGTVSSADASKLFVSDGYATKINGINRGQIIYGTVDTVDLSGFYQTTEYVSYRGHVTAPAKLIVKGPEYVEDRRQSAHVISARPAGSSVLSVCFGQSATQIDWLPCQGQIVTEYNTRISFADGISGAYLGSKYQLLSSTSVFSGNSLTDDKTSMHIMSGGTAIDINCSGGGRVLVWQGGNASSVIVSGSRTDNRYWVQGCGVVGVKSGGSAKDISVKANGYLIVQSGGIVSGASISGYLDTVSAVGRTTTGAAFVGAPYNIVYVGQAQPLGSVNYIAPGQGGVLIDGVVGAYGSITVTARGKVVNTRILDKGRVQVGGNCLAVSTSIQGGAESIYPQGSARFTTISAGTQSVQSDGISQDVSVISGHLVVSAGGSGKNITISSGGTVTVEGPYRRIQSGHSWNIPGSGRVHNITVHSGASLIVSSAAVAENVVNSGGVLLIDSEAHVTFNQWSDSQSQSIVALYNYQPGSGIYNIGKNCTASDVKVNASTGLEVYGKMYNTLIDSYEGFVWVGSGGVASKIQAYGPVYALPGGSITDITASKTGRVYVRSGGKAQDVVLSSGGQLFVSSGGIVQNVTVYPGAKTFIDPGAQTQNISSVTEGVD